MSLNKTTIPTETWVGLYSELADYILEYSSLDPIWTTDSIGDRDWETLPVFLLL